ncbi:hypothetical protein BDC45DRAFT_530501 [Circinella umbellata]|nr:hypothetical protein BDC45DRAFT_530501 [Circinella umbellata]
MASSLMHTQVHGVDPAIQEWFNNNYYLDEQSSVFTLNMYKHYRNEHPETDMQTSDFIKAILHIVPKASQIKKEPHFKIQGVRIRNEQRSVISRQQGIIEPVPPKNKLILSRIPLALEVYQDLINLIESDL